MAEREAEQKRIVVETPNARREEVYTQATRYPEDRRGVSGAALAAIVVGVVALAAIIILFVMNQQQNAVNDNATAQQQPPVIVQQPAAQPPVIITGQPAAAPASGGSTSTGPDDSTVQAAVDKKLSDDPALSALGITVTVMNGKATLFGAVHTAAEKNQVERAVRNVKGVKSIDNQITVSGE
jgi:ABC-type lipoprotein release transport system permease subunit